MAQNINAVIGENHGPRPYSFRASTRTKRLISDIIAGTQYPKDLEFVQRLPRMIRQRNQRIVPCEACGRACRHGVRRPAVRRPAVHLYESFVPTSAGNFVCTSNRTAAAGASTSTNSVVAESLPSETGGIRKDGRHWKKKLSSIAIRRRFVLAKSPPAGETRKYGRHSKKHRASNAIQRRFVLAKSSAQAGGTRKYGRHTKKNRSTHAMSCDHGGDGFEAAVDNRGSSLANSTELERSNMSSEDGKVIFN